MNYTKWIARTCKGRALVEIVDASTNQLIAVTDDSDAGTVELLAAAPEMAALIPRLVAVIDDFLPNIGRCVLKDFGELNSSLIDARALTSRIPQ